MSLLHQMDEECDCIEVIFQNYIQTRSTVDIFLFFEGKDDYKYYCIRIEPFLNGKVPKQYVCQKKDNVIELHDMIKRQTKSKPTEKLLFFVDKDFDRNTTINNDIYITPTYSIENFYISDAAIKRILIGEWGLSSEMQDIDKEDFEAAFNYLKSKRDVIVDSMIYANAWYSLQKRKTKDGGICPRLSAIKEYTSIKGIHKIENLEELVDNAIPVSPKELTAEINRLKKIPEKNLRGKYFEQTMPYYFMNVFSDSNKKSNRFLLSKRRKVNICIGKDNMVSILSQYADVPSCLVEYITKRLGLSLVG